MMAGPPLGAAAEDDKTTLDGVEGDGDVSYTWGGGMSAKFADSLDQREGEESDSGGTGGLVLQTEQAEQERGAGGAGDEGSVVHRVPEGVTEAVGAMDGARRADLALLCTRRDFGCQIQRGEQAGRGETDEAAGIVEEEREAGEGVTEAVGAMDGARRADLALLRTRRDFGVQIQRGGQAGRGEMDEAAGIVEEERETGAGSQAARDASQARGIFLAWMELEERYALKRSEMLQTQKEHQEKMAAFVQNAIVAMAAFQNASTALAMALRHDPQEQRRVADVWRTLVRTCRTAHGVALLDPPEGLIAELAAAVERRGGWPAGTCARWERGQIARVRRPQEGAFRPDLTATVQVGLEAPNEPPWRPEWRRRGRRGPERRRKLRASRGRNIYLAELRELGREFASFPYRGE